jgi:outer membrane protein W
MVGTALPVMFAGFLQAQDAVSTASVSPQAETAAPAASASGAPATAMPVAGPSNSTPRREASPTARVERTPSSRWFVRVGALGALYNSHATIASNGKVIPGATARVTDNVTFVFDVGYDVTDNLALMLTGGIPPRPAVIGEGAVSGFKTLGSVRYGPMFLTGIYRFPEWRGFRPYAGGGAVHAFVFRNYDGSVEELKVRSNWGYALQTGVDAGAGSGSCSSTISGQGWTSKPRDCWREPQCGRSLHWTLT